MASYHIHGLLCSQKGLNGSSWNRLELTAHLPSPSVGHHSQLFQTPQELKEEALIADVC